MVKNGKLIYAIVFIAGLIFIAVGFLTISNYIKYSREGVLTDATITNIERYSSGDSERIDVFVSFSVDGVDYSGKLDVYEIGFKVGKTVPILYLKDNPNSFIYAKRNVLLSVILFSLGGALVALSGGGTVAKLVRKAKIKRLKQNGKVVQAVVKQVQAKKKPVVIMGNEFKLISCMDDSGQLYEKKFLCPVSGGIKAGDVLTVYVNNDDWDDFVIDMDKFRKENLRTRKV